MLETQHIAMIALGAFGIGLALGCEWGANALKHKAVERGFAEWVKTPQGEIFRWKHES
jgi:hypothetical protein